MACPQRGRKRESSCESGESWAAALSHAAVSQPFAGQIFLRVSDGPINVMSQRKRNSFSRFKAGRNTQRP
jgi:hypothetical protein